MNIITKTFNQLYGLPCWGVKWDTQLNLSMSFGDPILKIREPYKTVSKSKTIQRLAAKRSITAKGSWWLWIYGSYWQISINGEKLATGTSSTRQKDNAIMNLEGQKLTDMVLNPQDGSTRFEFDLGGTLEIKRFNPHSKLELWMLYKPNGYVLSVRGNGYYSHERGSSSSQKWHSIQLKAGSIKMGS